ncbi:MAG TPA: lipid-A-disaccharide synthase [Nevskiaceae bacterium]|nr:lipid-A-disaccharide synthase [Nevskiaceae bacterium]
MKFALVAGEISGDILGAALIRALRAKFPAASFYGVAGPRMVEAGCVAIASIEELSIMGIAEVLPALPRLFRLRDALVERFVRDRPDCVIGIDAPDFNLRLERPLRERGLTTVHVVSPTVWAWRQGRVKNIARAVDLILCLFPFEPEFYAGHGVRADYIGHPLADELDAGMTQAQARGALGLDPARRVAAVLPGSRGGELKYLAEPFARAAALLHAHDASLQFVTPIAKPKLREAMQRAIAAHAPQVPWTLSAGRSREAMLAADAVLLASGTAALECALLQRPMVVAYRGSAFTAWLMLRAGLLKTRYVSLPNLLSEKPAVPELLQDAATPERLAQEVRALLDDASARERQLSQFAAVRTELKRDSAALAAQAIARLLDEKNAATAPASRV